MTTNDSRSGDVILVTIKCPPPKNLLYYGYNFSKSLIVFQTGAGGGGRVGTIKILW